MQVLRPHPLICCPAIAALSWRHTKLQNPECKEKRSKTCRREKEKNFWIEHKSFIFYIMWGNYITYQISPGQK